MSTLAADIDFNRLNNLLWRYRSCFDRFEFLLEMQLMVTASGRHDWQHHMVDLLDELAQGIGRLDLEREVILGGACTLSDLATQGPEVWAGILIEQQAHLAAAAEKVGRLRHRNEQAITAGAAGLRRLLEAIGEAAGRAPANEPESYGADGRVQARTGTALLFDGRV